MPGVRWDQVFTETSPTAGATEEELRALATALLTPVTDEEAAGLIASQSNPFPAGHPLHARYTPIDPRTWRLPGRGPPVSYLDFLRWSNGGYFVNGARSFYPLFAAGEVRGYLLSYHIPQYMPGVMPFALDGGGNFYLFDMRCASADGEYPVLFVHAGTLSYADTVPAGESFVDACTRSTDPMDARA